MPSTLEHPQATNGSAKIQDSATRDQEVRDQLSNAKAEIDAVSAAFAVIEFEPDGTIVTANDNFLHTLGYTLDDIQGNHHRLFVTTEYANSAEYGEFWAKLGRGESQEGEFLRIGKGGKEVPAPSIGKAIAAKRLFEGIGVIVAVQPRDSRLVVTHEEIKGFMAPMAEMSFMVIPATLLKVLKPGDKVRFTVDADKRAIVEVVKIER